MYELKFTTEAVTDIRSLPKRLKGPLRRVLVRALAVDPRGSSVELSEPLAGFRSFHWRDYRVVFRICEGEQVVAIVGIGERAPRSRTDIYRRLEALAEQGRLAGDLLAVLRALGGDR